MSFLSLAQAVSQNGPFHTTEITLVRSNSGMLYKTPLVYSIGLNLLIGLNLIFHESYSKVILISYYCCYFVVVKNWNGGSNGKKNLGSAPETMSWWLLLRKQFHKKVRPNDFLLLLKMWNQGKSVGTHSPWTKIELFRIWLKQLSMIFTNIMVITTIHSYNAEKSSKTRQNQKSF